MLLASATGGLLLNSIKSNVSDYFDSITVSRQKFILVAIVYGLLRVLGLEQPPASLCPFIALRCRLDPSQGPTLPQVFPSHLVLIAGPLSGPIYT